MPWLSHDEAELVEDIKSLGQPGGISWDQFKEKHPDKCKEATDESASSFSW
jgi:hypothetical protein